MPVPVAIPLSQLLGTASTGSILGKPSEDTTQTEPVVPFSEVLARQFFGPSSSILQRTIDTPSGKVFAPDEPTPAKPNILATYPQSKDQPWIMSSPMPTGEPKGLMGLPMPETQDKLKGFEKPQDVDTSKLYKDISFEDYKKLVATGKTNIASETDEEDFNKVLNKKIRAEKFEVSGKTSPFSESYEMGDLEKKAKDKKLYYEDDKYGTFYVGKSKSDVEELKNAETPYDYGKIYNYPENDIAYFYAKRRGGNLEYGYEEFLSDRNHHLNKKMLVGGENNIVNIPTGNQIKTWEHLTPDKSKAEEIAKKNNITFEELERLAVQDQIKFKKKGIDYDIYFDGKLIGELVNATKWSGGDVTRSKYGDAYNIRFIDSSLYTEDAIETADGLEYAKNMSKRMISNSLLDKNYSDSLANIFPNIKYDKKGKPIEYIWDEKNTSNPVGSLIDKPLSDE